MGADSISFSLLLLLLLTIFCSYKTVSRALCSVQLFIMCTTYIHLQHTIIVYYYYYVTIIWIRFRVNIVMVFLREVIFFFFMYLHLTSFSFFFFFLEVIKVVQKFYSNSLYKSKLSSILHFKEVVLRKSQHFFWK